MLLTENISQAAELVISLSCTNETTNTRIMKAIINTIATSVNMKMLLVVAVMLLSGSRAVAQNTIEVPAQVAASTTAVESNNNLNMVSWFMMTKQTANGVNTQENTAKKQMITSGIAPNRLLIKVLLKKASQYASNIA